MLRSSRHLLSMLLLSSALGAVHAAELGEARVASHIGQPLVADIELVMIDDPASRVSARVASREVYNGAGIAVPPALAGANLSVMQRDGRQFLHVTSLRPVDADHLHLYLELIDKGQRTVRLATLWLTPDPNPAPAPVPAPPLVTQAEPPPAPVQAAAPVPPPKAIVVPAPRPPAERKAEAVHAEPHTTRAAPAPRPLPIRAPQAGAPAACALQAEQAKVCAALDGKNAALKAQIGVLEWKVKSLQTALGAAPGVPAPAPGPAAQATQASPLAPAAEPAHEPPKPKPISAIKPLVPHKPKAPPEPEAGAPWGWIGAGAAVLLALSGAFLLLRRRARTVRNVDIPPAPARATVCAGASPPARNRLPRTRRKRPSRRSNSRAQTRLHKFRNCVILTRM
ncbi:hypothetical protein AB595_14475 [Massilia sp. WF1]|uniref:FimV/HubP-related protein n=1 Tax=Massilia sp. WF1 TaxID=1406431 RepID=UPI00064A38FB|nr:hypothetical protein [Massilia sp. WF1]KLU36185.1 hypothetical protein AB595_14475 [Massilia sp. WF1]